MKIKTKQLPYEQVMALPRPKHRNPIRPNIILRTVMRVASEWDLLPARFSYTESRMDLAKGPCLVLMNHSSFIDLEIAQKVLYPRPVNIVCTSDGFVGFGKELLMRLIGCIPTQKFVTDVGLIGDMRHALEMGNTVLMYPEASYSFDGCATPLPRKLGVLLKKLNVPVVTIITEGAFSRDPLYNCLQKRKVKVSAHVSCLLTQEELKEKSVAEIDAMLDEAFGFDNFRWQQENGIEIHESFRADGLQRILYQCAHCGTEGSMHGEGTTLTCRHCGKSYELTPQGRLEAKDGETEFPHIPDWYRWEREQVKQAILDGSYRLDTDVEIGMLVDYKAIYMVGDGHLTHDIHGFTLTGCDGKLEYTQAPTACYGLYSDYYWYEIGDVICFGNKDRLYYCFPKSETPVAKARLAAEELYKLYKSRVLTLPKGEKTEE